MTLTEFLLARIAEDEDAATDALTREHWACDGYGDFGPFVSGASVETEDSPQGQAVARYLVRANPWRALAECEAKRRIVAQVSKIEWAGYAVRDFVLAEMAAIYSDHPDYDEAWRPLALRGVV